MIAGLSDARVHPSFSLDIKFPVRLTNEGDLLDLWQCLSYRISREPDDLLAHTRRIRLCREPSLQDRLAGALLDLQYVLNGRGADLQSRLRDESLSALGDDLALLDQPATQSVKGRTLPTMTQLLRSKGTGDTQHA